MPKGKKLPAPIVEETPTAVLNSQKPDAETIARKLQAYRSFLSQKTTHTEASGFEVTDAGIATERNTTGTRPPFSI